MIATRFKFLRDVLSGPKATRKLYPMEERPLRVAMLLTTEPEFRRLPKMVHHVTVFLEDEGHDWKWRDGYFDYFGAGRETPVTLLIVFEETS